MLLKTVGAVIALAVGGYGAVLLNRRARLAVDRCDAWISLLRLVKNQIDCFSLPVSEILLRCDRTLLRRVGWEGESAPDDFAELGAALDGATFSEETVRVIRVFAQEIGKGYRAEQVRTCDYGIGLFCAERDRLLAELPRKEKRNLTLCLSAALGTVVVLI